MSTYPPHTRDVDQTINSIVQEAAALTTAATLRLVSSNPNPDRPAGLAVSSDPTMPVMLALGDFAQLLALSASTPMASQLEATQATIRMSAKQYQAVRLLLATQGTDWAENMTDGITAQVHPSFLPPSADEAPARGIPRPVLA